MKVLVVGGGLIGTSIALKVAKLGGSARVTDQISAHSRVANELLGGAILGESVEPDLVVVATPVNTISDVVIEQLLLNPRATIIDTGSIKSKVLLEVSTKLGHLARSEELRRFLPTHPMAGRELSGPDGARSDLFEGRAWAITPTSENQPEIVQYVEEFVTALGATPYRMSPEEHDQQVAMTSHLPQLMASAMAALLDGPLDLAGQGLRDMTRLAHSDIAMWQPIFAGNSEAISALVEKLIKSINQLKDKQFSSEAVLSLMSAGALGAAKVPGKHGGISRNYGSLSVVIPDRAGELARLFNDCAAAKINIEDLRIEHSPGQETGLISLYVKPDDLSTLDNYLSTLGWHATVLSKGN